MKRICSLLLILMLLVGIFPASAMAHEQIQPQGIEEYPTLELETDLVIECAGDGYTYVTFTPTSSGTFVFYGSTNGNDSVAELYDADMNFLDEGDDCGYGHVFHNRRDFCIVCDLEEGVTYVLGARYFGYADGQMTVRVDRDHVYESQVTKEATCTEDGEMTYTCVDCGYSFTKAIPAEHTYESEISKDVTCLEDGEMRYTCVVCGYIYTEVITARGHDFEYEVIKESTCTEDGLWIYTCTDCGGSYTKTISAYHDYESETTRQATCTEAGERTYTCTTCGDSYIEPIEPEGHYYDSEVTKEATCTKKGERTYTCYGCGDSYTKTIPAAHFYDYEIITEQTCTQDGEWVYTCVYCADTYTEVYPADHYFDYGEVTREATCTEDGEVTYFCEYCDAFYTEAIIARHYYEDYSVTKRATCTQDGEMTYFCINCDDSYTGPIPAGHSEAVDGICTNCFQECPTSGTCGENLTWVLTEDGTLTISGEGAMADYREVSFYCDAPWYPYHYENIKQIVIEPGVTTIGSNAFFSCAGVEDISIPTTVRTIGDYAFFRCDSPDGGDQWRIIIPEGVTHIGEGAFSRCYSLDTVSLPSTLTTVGKEAFSYTSLESIDIPGSLAVIPEEMFFETRSLKLITLHEGLKRIEYGAFSYCTPSEIIIPSTVEYVGEIAFGHCPLLDRFIVYSRNCEFETGFYYPYWADPDSDSFEKWTDYYSYPGTQKPEPMFTVLNYHELPEFTDLPVGAFYFDPVLWAVENGVTSGATADSFNPGGECLRAQVVTFLWRAAGQPEPTSTDNPFVDVKETDFYYKAVLWAVENGITSGTDATHFNPMGVCNRAQVVTFLYRAFGSPAVQNAENPFTDVPGEGWFTAPVLWAVENGITNGLSATAFGPNSACNRAQVVTFLYRAYVN